MLKKQRKISTLLKIIGSLRTIDENEAELELITDIRNRDQGFVLFCFCFFCCLFFFKSNCCRGNLTLVYSNCYKLETSLSYSAFMELNRLTIRSLILGKWSTILLTIGIQNTSSTREKDLKSSHWNPDSLSWNPKSKTVLESLTGEGGGGGRGEAGARGIGVDWKHSSWHVNYW